MPSNLTNTGTGPTVAGIDPPTTSRVLTAPTGTTAPMTLPLLCIAAAGGAVAVAIGVYGRLHQPTGGRIASLGFSSLLAMKAWLATGAFALALVQLGSALWLFRRVPRLPQPPKWLASAHRWTGTSAFVLSLPVAYHCLWSLGFQPTGTRQLVHSVLGCSFYGAFVTKMLALRTTRLPGWAVPVAGGLLVACLSGLWLTSALWFFSHAGLHT